MSSIQAAAAANYLLDVNALVSLGVRQHEFHTRVASWLASIPSSTLYLCPITELGFIRILSHNATYAFKLEKAKEQLAQYKAAKTYSFHFLADDQDVHDLPSWVKTAGQTTDGHLLQLAQAHNAMLATLDARIPGAFLIP